MLADFDLARLVKHSGTQKTPLVVRKHNKGHRGEVLVAHSAKSKEMSGETLILSLHVVEAQIVCSRKLKMRI